ncbi:MAG: hypothetical protein NTAFB05_17770 [Nitrobacter sp.]
MPGTKPGMTAADSILKQSTLTNRVRSYFARIKAKRRPHNAPDLRDDNSSNSQSDKTEVRRARRHMEGRTLCPAGHDTLGP